MGTLGRSIQVEHYVLMDQILPMVHQQHTSPATFTRSRKFTKKIRRKSHGRGRTVIASSLTRTFRSPRNILRLSQLISRRTPVRAVASCSNRGTCDEGTCECFKGYTNDNCDVQSSLA